MCGSVRDGETEGGGVREREKERERDRKRVYISELSVASFQHKYTWMVWCY